MPIEVHCPECQALLRIADENADRQSRCPSCSFVFTPNDVLSAAPPELQPTLPDVQPPTVAPSDPQANIDHSNPYAPSATRPDVNRQGSTQWAPTRLNVEDVFSASWAIFKVHWLMACVAILVVQAANFGASMLQNVLMAGLEAVNDPAIGVPGFILIVIASALFQMWVQIGQVMVMFDIARNREINLGKLFTGAPYLLNMVLASLMVAVIVGAIAAVMVGIPTAAVALSTQDGDAIAGTAMISFFVAMVPIGVVSLMLSQVQMLIIDRGLGPVEALHTSYEITNGNKLSLFVIGIFMFLIFVGVGIVGFLALCIGIIPAMIGFGAYSSLVMVVAYMSMTGQHIGVPSQFAVGPSN